MTTSYATMLKEKTIPTLSIKDIHLCTDLSTCCMSSKVLWRWGLNTALCYTRWPRWLVHTDPTQHHRTIQIYLQRILLRLLAFVESKTGNMDPENLESHEDAAPKVVFLHSSSRRAIYLES
ncbi:hypothetical protein HKD37_17G047466 [Glycine soja]